MMCTAQNVGVVHMVRTTYIIGRVSALNRFPKRLWKFCRKGYTMDAIEEEARNNL